ncbi:MAG: HU family DNA-binding protein [Acidaminococcaceae bacterium]|nr:HU family DNA-binding protein [Acidaminococcaceae bacterium]HAY61779.1 HU family DNA-binding protein [Acidaminococcaceae bacterium]HCJ90783.1 HU family DNA-binding protein [Acidaminococcaceae bacterium]
MNKKELIDVAAKEAELSKKDVEKALKALTGAIVAEVAKKGKVQLIGFGTFEARQRAARKGKNPQTKKEITIPAATVPAFKAGKAFKDAVNAKKPAKKAKKSKK